jgi:chemotaxis protein methyltransferase CheR
MVLSRASFEYVRAVLRQRSAHHLDDDKAYLVETRLQSLARRHGFDSVEGLVLRLRARADERLIAELVEAMTINETFFFRDGHPFEILRQEVLPELIRLRRRVQTLNIWCAACSSGQEPYSVALLLRHNFPELSAWNVRLIASDLSAAMLDRARAGRYSALEVSRGLSPELLATYFVRQEGGWQICEQIRRTVDFRAVNLSGTLPALPPLDLVLLRNVMIYFDIPTRKQILERVRAAMWPDGYLVLGGAESTFNLDDGFVPISFGQGSFYRPRASVGQPR